MLYEAAATTPTLAPPHKVEGLDVGFSVKYATHRQVPASRIKQARRMRIAMTKPERKFWKATRWRMPVVGTHFRRQVPIGPYIVDFCCLAAKLVVEVDGNRHGADEALKRDQARTLVLESEGFRVLHFSNADIHGEIDSVLDTIAAAMPPISTRKPISRDQAETQPHG